jgi:hypothetical protein
MKNTIIYSKSGLRTCERAGRAQRTMCACWYLVCVCVCVCVFLCERGFKGVDCYSFLGVKERFEGIQ